MTFVQVTFVLATFVHIMNISAVTNLILIKQFLWALIILDLYFLPLLFLDPKHFGFKILLDPIFLGHNIFEAKNLFRPKIFGPRQFWVKFFFFEPTFFITKKCGSIFWGIKIFLLNFFIDQFFL